MSLWKALAQKSYGNIIKRVRGGPFPLYELKRKPRLRSAQHNFSNLEEYLAILGVSAKIEQGLAERNQRYQFQGNIRVLQSKTSNKSTVLLGIPEHCREHILPGNKAKVYLEAGEQTEDVGDQSGEAAERSKETDEWFEEVGELPEEAGERSENSAFAILFPRHHDSHPAKTFKGKAAASTDDSGYIVPPNIPWPRDRSAAEPMSYIMENEGIKCKVKTVPRQSSYSYVFQAMEELQDTKDQDIFLVRAVKPFFLDKESFHRILLTSAGNKGADSLAAALHKQLQGLHKESSSRKHAYVIRLYSIKTEREIFLADARASRRKKLNPKSEMMPGPTLPHSQQETRDVITTHFHTYAKEKLEGVDDERVQNIELALGTRMKQMAGIQRDDNVRIIQDESFLHLYSRFSDEDDFNPKEMEEFEQAELIVVDEAARVPEYQWWSLLVFYPNAVGKIMVGDSDQLLPYVDEGEVATLSRPN
ncbi:hypothetical protein DL770_001200 [Monosporascus sp. CRB-9-2]|nr:hypothetical protein DL770_001200 [Monosporascus sp. CRB-9-2]